MSVCSWWHSVVWILLIIQWIYFTIWKKEKKNCYHYNTILSLYNIISRHYKKSLLRSQINHGYEELSTDTNYPIWRRQERRSKYAVQLASWQLRSNSPKMSVCPSVTPFWLCFYHRIIMKFSGVITKDQGKVHAKGQGQRSRSQRSQPNLTVSGLYLQFEFTYDDEMILIAWCCLGEVPYCFSRSSGRSYQIPQICLVHWYCW